MNTYPLPTEPGYYRRLFPDMARGRDALCTVYVSKDGRGALFFQLITMYGGRREQQDPPTVPLDIFEGQNGRPWYGPFETREAADAGAPEEGER